MNKIKSIFIVLVFSIFTFSCSKDDDTLVLPVIEYAEENPLNGYLETSGYNQDQVSSIDNPSIVEAGFSFKPVFNGKINSLKVWIPASNNSLRVTIWDNETQTAIRTEIVNVTSANVPSIKTIEPLFLLKNKEYTITMNSNDYYIKTKTDGTAAEYPIAVGNIVITSYREGYGAAQTFPQGTQPDYYNGNCSFSFQRTE